MQRYRGNICPIIQLQLEKTKRVADGWEPTCILMMSMPYLV